VLVRPNVRAKRTAAAGRVGPVGENVPRTANWAKPACRSGSALERVVRPRRAPPVAQYRGRTLLPSCTADRPGDMSRNPWGRPERPWRPSRSRLRLPLQPERGNFFVSSSVTEVPRVPQDTSAARSPDIGSSCAPSPSDCGVLRSALNEARTAAARFGAQREREADSSRRA